MNFRIQYKNSGSGKKAWIRISNPVSVHIFLCTQNHSATENSYNWHILLGISRHVIVIISATFQCVILHFGSCGHGAIVSLANR
jgi:hypothetical protein